MLEILDLRSWENANYLLILSFQDEETIIGAETECLLACSDEACAEKVCCKPKRVSTSDSNSIGSRSSSPKTGKQQRTPSGSKEGFSSSSFVNINFRDEKKSDEEPQHETGSIVLDKFDDSSSVL